MSFLEMVNWKSLNVEEQKSALKRPELFVQVDIKTDVSEILKQVKEFGDKAIKEFTLKFDKVNLNSIKVTEQEIILASKEISKELNEAIEAAINNLKVFHTAQKQRDIKVETTSGVFCEKRILPIEKVGLYIPAGTAPLPSTLMMLAVPALIAGCSKIVVTTPPQKDGSINPLILALCARLGLTEIYKCGGAQAIAALAYGTESIPKVDKIFGPGNAWVTEAKTQVAFDAKGAAIDLPAGPSEVLVVADEMANASFVASDLLSQAEHDVASQVILVTTSMELIKKVEKELELQLEVLPRRNIALSALKSSRAILASNLNDAMDISNAYAPEHLILHVADLQNAKSLVRHAGSVFLGPWSPESMGDYASGTNHVLPTYGFAKAFSGLSLESFTKSISFQELTPEGIKNLGPKVELLARTEGLEAHAQAVSLRLLELQKNQEAK